VNGLIVPILQTFGMACAGMLIALVLGIPLAVFVATRAPGFRFVAIALGALRAVPDLTLAILAVVVIGLGPAAGIAALAIFYTAMIGKVFGELMLAAPSAPVDAVSIDYVAENNEVMHALAELKKITLAAKAALLQGKLNDFGTLLGADWEQKRKLARQISTPRIDEMHEEARRQGALGGKILGAGGGGYMLLFCPFERKHKIAEAMARMDGELVEFAFEPHGVQTWTASEPS